MSLRAAHWALHEVHNVPHKLVLVALAEVADPEDVCQVREDVVARAADISRSTLHRTLDEYERLGLLEPASSRAIAAKGAASFSGISYKLHVGAQPVASSPAQAMEDLPVNVTGMGESAHDVSVGDLAGSELSTPRDTTAHIERYGEYEGLSQHEAALLSRCLPLSMQVMDAPGAAEVVALLQERLEAGWTPERIVQVLDSPLPPGGARRMSSLVAWRLRSLVDPALAPKPPLPLSIDEQAAYEAQRRARSEALASPSPSPTQTLDPLVKAAIVRIRAAEPALPTGQVVLKAIKLVKEEKAQLS